MRQTLGTLILLLIPFLAQSASADTAYRMTVAQDGSGEFTRIQDAINATKSFPDRRITIHIKNGVYPEKVRVFEWNNKVSLIGEDRDKTVIRFDDHFKKIDLGRNSTFHTATLQIDGNDFHAENLTIENTAGPVGQALALAVNADRVSFYNSRFLGHQDTIYVTGEGKRQYFKDCYVSGTTDFIFGQGTAVFENCQLHSRSDSYITAASTPKNVEHGLVFINARLTADKDVSRVHLGRPWRPHAKTVFINSDMGAHIVPEGWDNWSNPDNEKTAFFAEYNSRGPGGKSDKRVDWAKSLSDEQAQAYTLERILGGDWFKR